MATVGTFPTPDFAHDTMKVDIIFFLSIRILISLSIFFCVTIPVSEGIGTVAGQDSGFVFALLSFLVFMAYVAYMIRRK